VLADSSNSPLRAISNTWHSLRAISWQHPHRQSMCADVTPTSSSSPSFASTRRLLLSRLTLPLRSRTRNLTDFHIRAEDPHRRYSPGDLVKGAVVLTVVKPVRVTHLTICLHGFARVFKRANEAKQPLPADALTAPSNGKKSQNFGNGHASLFQEETTLCGEGRLESGIYEFNFEMEFPSKGLPTSIDARSPVILPPDCELIFSNSLNEEPSPTC
jgi:hypothetical protein